MTSSFHIAVELARQRELELRHEARAARTTDARASARHRGRARRGLLERVSSLARRALAASQRRGATHRG